MAVHRNYGFITFECDICDNTFDAETDDFDVAWASAKKLGWKVLKDNGEWEHRCPECAEEE
jgi:hypothetical protein